LDGDGWVGQVGVRVGWGRYAGGCRRRKLSRRRRRRRCGRPVSPRSKGVGSACACVRGLLGACGARVGLTAFVVESPCDTATAEVKSECDVADSDELNIGQARRQRHPD
jgi:hypothetical protein